VMPVRPCQPIGRQAVQPGVKRQGPVAPAVERSGPRIPSIGVAWAYQPSPLSPSHSPSIPQEACPSR
jgi:hypothetical protein